MNDDYPITGLHYLFWNPPEDMVDGHLFSDELRPTYDVCWSNEAADELAKGYEAKGISFFRIDYPREALGPTEKEGLGYFARLPSRERQHIAHLFFRNIKAERHWRKWLKEEWTKAE